MIVKAIVERPWPPSVSTPKIVEYQCGSSDMTQSTLMKVIEATKSTRPGPETIRERRSFGPGSSAGCSSCSLDHLLRMYVSPAQIAKKITARSRKNDGLRYAA